MKNSFFFFLPIKTLRRQPLNLAIQPIAASSTTTRLYSSNRYLPSSTTTTATFQLRNSKQSHKPQVVFDCAAKSVSSSAIMATVKNSKKYALFICDIQEAFRNAIYEFPTVVSTAQKLLQASQSLKIPTIVTTQNAARLGSTVSELTSYLPPPTSPLHLHASEDKSLFSMITPSILSTLRSNSITSIAIVGIESHVCVLQTCLDLLREGFEVYAIADGISSCNKEEVPIAIARMRQEGVRVSTSESWLYEVMVDAARPEFREVLKVVKSTKESTKDGLEKLCKSLL